MTNDEAIGVLEDVRDAICENIPGNHPELDELREAVQMAVNSLQERKKGKWILDEDPHDGDCRCSVCLIAIDQMHERNHGLLNALTGGKWWTFYKFCPNCGADMRGDMNETDRR